MKGKRGLLVLLCVAAIVASTIFGTLAYLTDSDANTNTFTVGNIRIKLDEAAVNPDGSLVTGYENRVHSNQYHLLPGQTYIKDPRVTVAYDSEDAYVRMLVKVDNIDQLKAAIPQQDNAEYYGENGLFLLQKLCKGWDPDTWLMTSYAQEEKTVEGKQVQVGVYEFRYKEVVKKENHVKEAAVLPYLFKAITVPGEIDNDHLAYLAEVKINVEAHAIQAAGFDNADAAWAAFDAQVNP